MHPTVSQITPGAVPAFVPSQSTDCATANEAHKPEFADREAYFANVRRGVAALSGEVEK
jgi:hypothetical protein